MEHQTTVEIYKNHLEDAFGYFECKPPILNIAETKDAIKGTTTFKGQSLPLPKIFKYLSSYQTKIELMRFVCSLMEWK